MTVYQDARITCAMHATATGVQFRKSKIGARSGFGFDLAALAMSGYYPLDDDADVELKATSVRVPMALYRDIEFIAELWNEFDKVRDVKRPSRWKPSSVMERLLQVGRDGFVAQLGGFPESDEERAEFIRRAKSKVADLAAKLKK